MGNFLIIITGTGTHHNRHPEDADAMAAVFVGELRAAGHTVTQAEFHLTGGQHDNLLELAPMVSGQASNVEGYQLLGTSEQVIGSGSAPREHEMI